MTEFLEEKISPYLMLRRKVKRVLKEIKHVHNSQIVELEGHQRSLFMDGLIQSSESDFRVYHEALVHPALLAHPNPAKVLVAGGGELCTLAEVLKHPHVRKATMVDIDGAVVDMCKQELSFLHGNPQNDPRASVVIEGIYEFAQKQTLTEEDKYDVLVYDIVDPIESREAAKVYTVEVLRVIKEKCLKKDAVVVSQATSLHILNGETAARLRKTFEAVFGNGILYKTFMPSFMENWGFALAALGKTGSELNTIKSGSETDKKLAELGLVGKLTFYDEETHLSMFSLEKNVRALVYSDSIQEMTLNNLSRLV